MNAPNGTCPQRPSQTPPAVVTITRTEQVVLEADALRGDPRSLLLANADNLAMRARTASHPLVQPGGDLLAGQREFLAVRAREAQMRAHPGIRPITLWQVAAPCIKESGLFYPPALAEALASSARVELSLANTRLCPADAVRLRIQANVWWRQDPHRLYAEILGTALTYYGRSLIPAVGLEAARALWYLADMLVVVDAAHSFWLHNGQNVTPPRRIAPMLLAIVLEPFARLSSRDSKEASLFLLCQWT